MGPRHSVVVFDEAPESADAFYQFFDALPPKPDAAFVLAVPPDRGASLVASGALGTYTSLPVTTVTTPTSVAPNQIYLSPPGQMLVLRRDVLVPATVDEWETASVVPVVHVLRRFGRRGPQAEPPQEETAEAPLRLAVPPSIPGGTDAPLVVVDDGEEVRRAPEIGGVDPWGTSRTERLEAELRETQRELRDMVQKYEFTHRRLQEKNELLEERTEQVRGLSEALTLAEEKERERLSHVLHDDLQQVLYAVRTKLTLVMGREGGDDRERTLLARALELIDDGIDTTRTLASDLNPPVENSLWDALEWLTIRMQEAYGLSVEMQASSHDRAIDKSLRILVFRLVRELLFNVVKHAGTDEARLVLKEDRRRLYVIVEDDGIGFHPDNLEEETGEFGLTNVRRRIEHVGGSVEITSAPGEGTRVQLGVPFQIEGTGA
jgi:signal transduction histidine kinase